MHMLLVITLLDLLDDYARICNLFNYFNKKGDYSPLLYQKSIYIYIYIFSCFVSRFQDDGFVL